MLRQRNDTTRFLNVDLDIYSISDLQPLVTALGDSVSGLYVGRTRRTYEAHLEVAFDPRRHTPDAIIRRFAALIDALPRAPRKLWDSAKIKEFNIGVQAAGQPNSWETQLSTEAVEAAARVQARIGLTIYSPEMVTRAAKKSRGSTRRRKSA